MKPERLSDEAAQGLLIPLTGWRVEGVEILKEYRFSSYLEGIDFVHRVAHLAEAMNHHPDLFVGWRKVGVRLTTHSAGGLTSLDFELAGKIDAI